MHLRLLAVTGLLLIPRPLFAQNDTIVPGPPDRAVAAQAHQMACVDSLLAPRIAKGRATYPAVRARFLAGLPARHRFLISTNLIDQTGRRELVFILVHRVGGDTVYGQLASDLQLVQGIPPHASIGVLEDAILDWTIARPDGTEEGNAIGVFVDSLQGRFPC